MANQNLLKNTLTNPNEFKRSRVLRYDLQTQNSQEFLYNAETIPLNIFAPGLTAVSEILALDSTGDRYLALERTYVQSSPSVFSARLYEFDLKGATDIRQLQPLCAHRSNGQYHPIFCPRHWLQTDDHY
jgi:Esterase-like activity of phytase